MLRIRLCFGLVGCVCCLGLLVADLIVSVLIVLWWTRVGFGVCLELCWLLAEGGLFWCFSCGGWRCCLLVYATDFAVCFCLIAGSCVGLWCGLDGSFVFAYVDGGVGLFMFDFEVVVVLVW